MRKYTHNTILEHKGLEILLAFSFVAFIVQVILLSLRLDYYINISYYLISIPIWVISGALTVWTLTWFIIDITNGVHEPIHVMGYLIIIFTSQGAFWSFFLLSKKLQDSSTNTMTYLICFIPILVASVIGFVGFIVILTVIRNNKYSRYTRLN